MKKKAIIHISDLHVMLHTEVNGDPLSSELKSMLTTDPERKASGSNYLKKITKHILDNYKGIELYLIITGDISDQGLEEEFDYALYFLNLLIKQLKISKDKVLLVPGDHDVNWFDCKTAFFKDKKKKKDFEYLEKYNQFSAFYKKFKGSDFEDNNTITDVLEFKEEKIVFIGINSNYKIGFKSGYGYVDIESFRKELDLIKNNYNEYSKIAVFHSNIVPFFETKIFGQWDENNRNEVIDLLKEYQFKASFFGNEHTSGSKEENEFYYIEAGSLTMCDTKSQSFKVFEVNNDVNELVLNQNLHHLIDINRNAGNTWSWTKVPDTDLIKGFKELKEIKLIIKPTEELKPTTLFETDEPIISIPNKEPKSEDTTYPYINFLDNPYHHKIFNRVRELKIFHSGHFHWSDNSKAHNWIEVAKLLNDKEDVLTCKKAILDIVEKSEIDFDFIIGLGIEGNILATRTAMVCGEIPYSYLPYSYRYEDHADYEQRLSVENSGFKKILIITDVVHDGNTIRKLINEKEPVFFKEVEEIYVISLFYSGKDDYNLGLINMTQAKKDLEKGKGNLKYEHQPIEERIKFYFVSKMVVETCPYGAEFRETCMIVKYKLDCVHEFYDAKK
jgi:3',5'-cyclic AMP phosphodiesterase CpdA/adenine/guanine phosphoribosyltransferase-like PRPP-binding protein